ncbi:MAG: CotH kinase family protein [Fibrobacteraceae bacterium]|nr:CotH kinase family protein [Fibrobacteraceae bacterium]
MKLDKIFFETLLIFMGMVSLVACSDATLSDYYEVSAENTKDSLVVLDSSDYQDSVHIWFDDKDDVSDDASDDVFKDTLKVDEDSLEQVVSVPSLLPPAGFYQSLEIPVPQPLYNGIIRCSFDGSDVSETSPEFEAPFVVTVNTVARCGEFVKSEIKRKATETYFIGETVNMPVVAISVAPSFFATVYVNTSRCEGQNPYYCPGLMNETETPVHVEFFEKGSSSEKKSWEVDAGISLMGNYSRTYPKKPVAIKIKKEYQEKKLKYSLFYTRPEVNKFRGFNLRNSGNRYVGDYIGDPAMTAIVEGSSVDYQRSRQVVVFYNGEYYGIHDLRERLNEHFVETNYGIDNNTVEMIKQKKDTITASAGTGDQYRALLNFVANNDFSGENNAAYAQLQNMMDVGNYADYLTAQFYLANADWPSNNVRAWCAPGQPFKFILFDADQGLGWQWVSSDFMLNGSNMFNWMKNDRGEGRTGPGYFANIYIKLMKNTDFRRLFANHGAVMLNEYLTYERLAKSVAALNEQIPDAEIDRDMAKFPREYYCGFYEGLGCGFDRRGDYILKNAIGRNEALRSDFRAEFGFEGDMAVRISSVGGGYVTIDGMKLPKEDYEGVFFDGNKMLLKAVATAGVFAGWEDGSKENPRLVTPTPQSAYKAIFK